MSEPEFIKLSYKARDITGQRFGRLLALGPVGLDQNQEVLWLCQCDCGNIATKLGRSMRKGSTQSCGCFGKQRSAEATTIHGMWKEPIYHKWIHINERCEKESHHNFHRYGERGIKMCDEWRHDFVAFYTHISQLEHFGKEGYTLDRRDNEKGYEPGNVRWATAKQQQRNRHNNHMITHNGETFCLAEWAERVGISYQTIKERLKRGWSAEKALTTPIKTQKGASHE